MAELFFNFLFMVLLCTALLLRWSSGEAVPDVKFLGSIRHLEDETEMPDRLKAGQTWLIMGQGHSTGGAVFKAEIPGEMWDVNVFVNALDYSATTAGATVFADVEEAKKNDTESVTISFKPEKPGGAMPSTSVTQFSWMAMPSGWYSHNETGATLLVGRSTVPSGAANDIQFTSKWHAGKIFTKPPGVIAQVQGTKNLAVPIIYKVDDSKFTLSYEGWDGKVPSATTISWLAFTKETFFPLPGGIMSLTIGVETAKASKTYLMATPNITTPTGCGPAQVFANAPGSTAVTIQTTKRNNLDVEVQVYKGGTQTTGQPLGIVLSFPFCTSVSGGQISLSPSDAAEPTPAEHDPAHESTIVFIMAGGVLCIAAFVGGIWALWYFVLRQPEPPTAEMTNLTAPGYPMPNMPPQFNPPGMQMPNQPPPGFRR